MKNTLLALPALAAVALLAGCATPNTWGGLYSAATVIHGGVTDNPIGSKVGTSKVSNIIGISEGDIGIGSTAKKAGISKVGAWDIKVKNILGIVTETEIQVYGE
jgi:hypothetical protein